MTRRGFGALGAVIVLCFAAGLIVMAYHTLWRGSSRSLYSVQEHRQLVNLCRSGVAEAAYKLQTQVEQGSSEWIDWCTSVQPTVKDRAVAPKFTREFSATMTNDERFLSYSITEVALARVHGLTLFGGMSGGTGVVDFTISASVERRAPSHRAKLTLTERRVFSFSDAATPFAGAGRHIEFFATPAATFLEYE